MLGSIPSCLCGVQQHLAMLVYHINSSLVSPGVGHCAVNAHEFPFVSILPSFLSSFYL